MPTPQEIAQRRAEEAFARPVVFNKGRMSTLQIRRVNAIVKRSTRLLVAVREQISQRTASDIAADTLSVYAKIGDALSTGAINDIATHAHTLYRSLREDSSESAVTVAKRMREYIRSNTTAGDFLLRTLRRAGRAAYGDSRDAGAASAQRLNAHRVLVAEAPAKLINRLSRGADESRVYAGILEEVMSKTLTPSDALFVDIVLGQTDPDIIKPIIDRNNFIVAVNISEDMFRDIREIMLEGMYFNTSGALGAIDIARKFATEFAQTFASSNMSKAQANYRAMLWARTEGTVIQNDMLMHVGKFAGMDGKVWDDVGDSRVRQAHSLNGGAGVIPVNDVFPDGSTDAGSGSRSPFNCRCVCGPALLPQTKDTQDKRTKQKEDKTELPPISKTGKNAIGKLQDADKNAIRSYIEDAGFVVNDYLRSGVMGDRKDFIAKLDTALLRMQSSPGTSYRGITIR